MRVAGVDGRRGGWVAWLWRAAHKDRAARLWRENATPLTGTAWGYVKVPQGGFGKLQPDEFGDLMVFDVAPLPVAGESG